VAHVETSFNSIRDLPEEYVEHLTSLGMRRDFQFYKRSSCSVLSVSHSISPELSIL